MKRISTLSLTLTLTLLATVGARVDARADDSHDMVLIGTNDLQARSTYQPTIHKYPLNRYILFTGHHTLALQGEGLLPNAQPLPSFNPLTGHNEENGTSIVDVTHASHPIYLFHIPVS